MKDGLACPDVVWASRLKARPVPNVQRERVKGSTNPARRLRELLITDKNNDKFEINNLLRLRVFLLFLTTRNEKGPANSDNNYQLRVSEFRDLSLCYLSQRFLYGAMKIIRFATEDASRIIIIYFVV